MAVTLVPSQGWSCANFEEFMNELEHAERLLEERVPVTVVSAGTGAFLAEVLVTAQDTVAQLSQSILRKLGEETASLQIIFNAADGCPQLLRGCTTLQDAGIGAGDTVFVVKTQNRCLSASQDGTVRAWSLQGADTHQEVIADLSREFRSAAFSHLSSNFVTIALDGQGCLRCGHSGDVLAKLSKELLWCKFSHDGKALIGASEEDAHVWCAQTGEYLHPLNGHTDEVKAVASSPGLIATGSCDTTARIFHEGDSAPVRILHGHDDVIRTIDFSPNGKLLVTGSVDSTARVWDVETGTCLQVLNGHSKALHTAVFSQDGASLLTASFDGTVRLWNLSDSACRVVLKGDSKVVNFANFSPDGKQVLIASGSEVLRLYDAFSGECAMSMVGHSDWIRHAAFSPNGLLIVSASYDGSSRVWSSSSGTCLKVLNGHTSAVLTATVTGR